MERFWYFIYNYLTVPIFWILFHFGSLFSPKIRRAIRGRRNLLKQIKAQVKELRAPHRVWFHSSSLGEFEQAKPIIAALRKRFRSLDVIVTFFSPSGYEHSRNYKLASMITYIPFDSARNARMFLDLTRPTVAVMVRYDIWPNHVWELARRGVPTFIANATLRSSSGRHWPFIHNFHRYLYNHLTSILTVSESDAASFQRFSLTHPHIEVVGDTRYDQVWQRSIEAKSKHLIPDSILKRKKVFVVGSSWTEDEEVILPAFQRLAKEDSLALMILVPHEPTLETLDRLEASATKHLRIIRFSDLNDYSNENIILVDSIGILVPLYRYATVTYVGGSFRQGVHNVLEPAVYGLPVLFGPRHENSQEAVALVRRGGGFVVTNADTCYSILRRLMNNKQLRQEAGARSFELVKENIGATERFLRHLEPLLNRSK